MAESRGCSSAWGIVLLPRVKRPITIGNFNIGGVLLSGGYTWKKYNTVATTTYTEVATAISSLRIPKPSSGHYAYNTKTFDSTTGKFTLSGRITTWTYAADYNKYPYFLENFSNQPTGEAKVYHATSVGTYGNGDYAVDGYVYTTKANQTIYSQGTYIEDVISTDANAYPDNGRHTDGYWYVRQ